MSENTSSTYVEQLLLKLLDVTDADRLRQLDELCAQQPQLAEELRERFSLMQSFQTDERSLDDTAGEQHFGPFTLLRQLGGGGMGLVYLARQSTVGVERQVALKILRPGVLGGEQAHERLRREARAAARLDHQALCPVYEVGEVDGTPYIAMRYVPGESLAEALRRHQQPRRKFDLSTSTDGIDGTTSTGARSRTERIVAFIERVARGLHVAHAAGLVHRDVKPGNIMVTPEGLPVLLDFGIVRDESEVGESLTMSGAPIGTPAYMAPEQVRGLSVAATTDVYALGATLFECLALHPPFAAETRDALYYAIVNEPAPDLRSRDATVPRDLATIVSTALRKDPRRRFASALEFADDLRRWREHRPIRSRAPSLWSRVALWSRRNSWAAALLLFAAIALPLIVWQSTRASYERDRALANLGDAREAVAELSRTAIVELAEIPQTGPIRRRFLERALAFHRRFAEQNAGIAEVRNDVIVALVRSGRLLNELSRYEEAVPILREARDRAAGDSARLAEIELELASALTELGEFEEAESLLASVIDTGHAQPLASTLVQAMHSLGLQRKRQGDTSAALRLFESSVDLVRQLPPDKQPASNWLIGQSLGQIAGIHFDTGDSQAAWAGFDTALAALDHGTSNRERGALASVLRLAGFCRAQASDHDTARNHYTRGLSITQKLAADFPETPSYATAAASLQEDMATIERVAGNDARATEFVTASLATWETIATRFPAHVDVQYGLLKALYSRGRTLQSEPARAIEFHERAVTRARRLIERFPSHARFRELVSFAGNSWSAHLWELNQPERALDILREAAEQAEILANLQPDHHKRRSSWAHRLTMLGSRSLETGDRDAGIMWLDQGLAVRIALALAHPDIGQYGIDVVNGFSRYVRPAEVPDAMDRLTAFIGWLDSLSVETRTHYEKVGEFAEFRSWLLVRFVQRAAPIDTKQKRAAVVRALAADPTNAELRAALQPK